MTADTASPHTDVERVLAITAHPDDIDFGAAGTIATLTDCGVAVTYCVCTDGQAGGFDPDVPRERMPEMRRQEQRAAAAKLAVTRDLVRELVAVIRDVRPQRVMLPNPERWWDRIGASHPDHMAAGEAAIRAVYPFARNPFAFPELLADGLEPWVVEEVWVMAVPDPNTFVDVSDVFEQKIDAIMAHDSQHPEPDNVRGWVSAWLTANAETGGLAQGRLAEVFRAHKTG